MTLASVATDEVVIAKLVELAPAGIVTDAGTEALALFELSDTDKPPGPAAPLRETVPVADEPPATEVGETETAWRLGALIVRFAVTV